MMVKLTEAQKIKVLNADDLYAVMQQILLRENKIRRNQEHFWVVGLNQRNKILFIELIGLGAANRVNAAPPDVFRMGIYKLAVSMILVHNHPSGETQPSHTDRIFTDRMLKAGRMLLIEVIDHLIIAEDNFYSFARAGVIEELRHSGLFEIQDEEKKLMQKLKMESEIKKALKGKSIEIATKALKKGFPIEAVQEISGLTKKEVEKLKGE